jgi:hypothetical protein
VKYLIELTAMGVKLPDIKDGHPNRSPFKGILTKVDEPSDKAPSGSHGHRVLIPAALARQKLDTLIGMGVGMTANLEDHDNRFKIGHITEAYVQGNDLLVEGILFAKDFEEEVGAIKSAGNDMGMSFEIADVSVKNPDDDIWVLHDLTFTGAAILKRASAAYETTSLIAAKASDEQKESAMTVKNQARKAAQLLGELQTVYAQLEAMGEVDETVSAASGADVEAGDPNRAMDVERRKEKLKDNQFKKDQENFGDQDVTNNKVAKAAGDDEDEVGNEGRYKAGSEEALVAAALKALKAEASVEKFESVEDVVAAFKKVQAAKANAAVDTKKVHAMAKTMADFGNAIQAMGMDYGGGGDMKSMLMKMMSMCKAMMQGMDPGGMDPGGMDPGGMDPGMEHEDEDQDMNMLKRLVKKMESYAGADKSEQSDPRFEALEASVGLITDSVKKMTGLLTDSQNKGKKLATDDASRRAEDGKKVERKTLSAGGEYTDFLSKYGIEADKDYTVQQIDNVLRDAGVTDPGTRIAIKHGLEAQGQLN